MPTEVKGILWNLYEIYRSSTIEGVSVLIAGYIHSSTYTISRIFNQIGDFATDIVL
jgi:hypothetical protein